MVHKCMVRISFNIMDNPFFWGAATSSHQVEGGNKNDWSEWEKSEARIAKLQAEIKSPDFKKRFPDYIFEQSPTPAELENYASGQACDHYHRFSEDFNIAKSLSHNAHRFSIEWSRIEPEEGKFDPKEIEHYRQVVNALRERGLEPFLTLWHWTLPIWLAEKGGTKSRQFPAYFERYAKRIADSFGSDVRFWITVNEPEVYSAHSYFKGTWPPQKKSVLAFYRSISNLAEAHRRGYRAIKSAYPAAQIGSALHFVYFESAGGLWNDTLETIADRAWNFYFLNRVRHSIDFIGANYYHHNRINFGFNKNVNASVSDMGWEIYPEGIYHLVHKLNRFSKPIYITENGLADARDAKRSKFTANHIAWVRKAIKEGVNVRGYFHWSLLDNFEWDKGFWPRFGLVEIDYKTLERKIRPSAWEYKEIIDASK